MTQNYFDQFDEKPEASARGLKGWVRDIGAGLTDLAIGVPEAVVGLADIPTGGAAGKFLENKDGAVGLRFKDAREVTSKWYSDATQEAERKFQEADGVAGKTAAAIENPSVIAKGIGTSLGSMGLGGVAARGLMAATRLGQMGAKGAVMAGAAGEGATMAGSQAEQIRQETQDGMLTPGQAGLALATGVAGGAFSLAGGKLAQRLGIGDAETMLAQGTKGMAKQFADDAATTAARAAGNPLVADAAVKSIPRKVIEGAISEGFLEELPQSMAEQIFQNIALDKPWHEDLDSAAVMGVLSGGAMGAGAAGYRGFREPNAKPGSESATGAAPGATGELGVGGSPQPNAGLARVSSEFAARLQALQEQEQGEAQVAQTMPPDGAAALARQQAHAQAARDAEIAASRAVESPDDEILQSTGAAVQRPSAAMGLRSGPEGGALESAAALAVDTGAHGQLQEAAAQAQAAQQAEVQGKEAQKVEQQTKTRRAVDAETGEISGPRAEADLTAWADADLSNAFRGAQDLGVRRQLAKELSRRRAQRAESAPQADLTTSSSQPPATAPGANAKGANVATLAQLNRKKLADMSLDELHQLSSLLPGEHARQEKIQKAIQNLSVQEPAAINQGAKSDGTQTDQAQQGSAQPAQAGAAQAGQPTGQGLTNGPAPTSNPGAQATAPASPQAQAAEPTREQRAQRIAAAGERWTRMPAAERAAIVGLLEGVKPVLAKNMPGAQWGNLNADIQRKLADAMAPAAQPIKQAESPPKPIDISTNQEPAAIENVANGSAAGAVDQVAVKQSTAVGDEKPFAVESGTLGIPRADMPQVPTASHGGLVKHLNAQGIAHETTTVDAASLKPTQAEYSPSKVEAAKGAGGDRAVIVSKDGHIIDGHHQAVAAAEDGKQVKAIVLDATVEQALEAVKASPSAAKADDQEGGKKKPRGVLAKKAEAEAQARAEYFTPGNIVKSYGGHDRVVSYNPNDAHSGWSVTVQAVRKEGDAWVDAPGERERVHWTQADKRELAAGPVDRVMAPTMAMSDDEFAQNLPAFLALYRSKAQADASNPDYYNADLAKELFPEYNASKEARRDNNEKVAPRASKIAFTAFEERIKRPLSRSDGGVALMAGGTGSGKSSLRPKEGIVYDSTMYQVEAAKRNIEKVLATDRRVDYNYVFTQPESAFMAAVARGKSSGRYVNLTAFVRTHEGAYQTAQALMREYEGGETVRFVLFDNTDFAGARIEKIPPYDYNGLREKLTNILDAEYQAGRISADEYRAIARTDPAGTVQEADGRALREPENRGSEQSEGLVGAPEEFPLALADQSYDGISHSGRQRAQAEHAPGAQSAPKDDAANFDGAAQRRPASAQDKSVIQAIADGKSARDVLRLVASGSKDPFSRHVARLLLRSGITPNIEFGHIGKGKNGAPIHGQYRGKSDTIAIAGSAEYAAERIFMHEAMHAATMRALAKPSMAKLQMEKLLAHVRKQKGAAGFYGTKNVDEFVAEVFTNPDFQQALRQMSAPAGGTIKSAWDGFVRILRGILGLSSDSTSALSQALNLGVAAMREDMVLRKQGARHATGAESADLQRARVLQGAPVAVLRLEDAPAGGYADIERWAADLFARQGGGAVNPEIGEVTLDARAAKSSLAHGGANAAKKIAFAAVKDVIEKGALVYSTTVGNMDSFYVAAPVSLSGRDNIVTVLVRRDHNTQRMYLHSVSTKESLLNPRVSSVDAAKAASERSGSTNSGDAVSVANEGQRIKATSAEVARELHRLMTLDSSEGAVANFGTDELLRVKDSALAQLNQVMSHPGKVSIWDKTVGTMRNLAERAPEFKPVFENAQRFIDDVSTLANEAADAAPRLLPRVETMGDLKKKPITAADNKAVAKPLFEGTLMWARDLDGTPVTTEALSDKYRNMSTEEKAQIMLRTGKIEPEQLKSWKGLPIEQFDTIINNKFDSTILKPGLVWSAKELRTLFGANDLQVSLYQEARAAIDRSIDITARTDMLRLMGEQFADMRQVVLEQPTMQDAFDLVVETLQAEARSNPEMADRLLGINNSVVTRYDAAKELMDKGYAPLSRFGQYTLDVVDKDGERQYFGMFESKREANIMKMRMAGLFPGATITQGTMSQQAFKLFQGITPESLEMFGEMLGMQGDGAEAKDKAFQAYLQLAKNNHSALKRLIHRKGIDGYSEDVGRVLASFVYSNARLGANGLNAGTLERAVEGIPKEMGELRDVAMGLRSYIQDPQEEGQAVRGFLFAQYLGGSVASAAVNMTQPFQITMPWLSQYGGMGQAAKQMVRALKDMGTKGFQYEADLAKALQDAEDDGTVSPQEIHQLMAQARGAGSLRTGDGTRGGDARAAAANNWERLKVAWGQPFALAEQFNRRSTFIASYRIAKVQGMPNPAEFARKAVLETQFLYSKANKMRWARGAVGGALMTFKTYSVSYLELMHRMWTQGGPEGKRAVAWSVAMLLLMAGAGGLPFMEDAEDLIDGAGQLMGYNLSSKQWRKDLIRDVVGKELADFMEQGVSGLPGAPIDVSGRMGLGNLIPGTGLFLSKQSRERDLLEVAGPAGDLVARAFTGGRKVLTGDLAGAALEVSPTAVRNWAKGLDMGTSGIYKDTKGYKVIDTTVEEAIAKFFGFQPKSVAEVQEANSFMQRSKSFYVQTSSDFKAQWAQALFEKDDAGLQRVRSRLEAWNRDNPDQPIVVKMPDIWKKVREMGKDRTQRIAETAPKALRGQMQEMAREASR
jgi:hypothetical protein